MAHARPFAAPADFPNNHVVSITQFDRGSVEFLCATADIMRAIVERKGGCDVLKHKILANVFYEPSTRTSSSFAAAMQRLGGSVLQINESTSSAVKGETLSDSIKAMQCYADAVVLRHPQQGSAAIASAATPKPVLNAGDGTGEHPTQALLDAHTIRAELGGKLDGLTVTMVGDLKNGRTVHSLARLLSLFDVKLNYVAPAALSMPSYVVDEVGARLGPSAQASYTTLEADVLAATDVLYVTRVQKERFASAEEYERLKHAFIITPETLRSCKARMVVMHPLPRVGEIDEAVDADPRAAYFRQMQHGLHLRMALLALVLGVTEERLKAEAAA